MELNLITDREILNVELDLLNVLIEVCNKHNLRYFVVAGTLLGAARHKGFIPWDDDIDVVLPREDYDKLWEVAENEFKYPYFFQTTLTEKHEKFFRTHAQLRNSLTTGCIEKDASKNINRGIFIDIFPLDNIPASRIKRFLLKYEILVKRSLMTVFCKRIDELRLMHILPYILLRPFSELLFRFVSFEKFFIDFNKHTLGKYRNIKTEYVGDLSLTWRENVIWPRKYFDGDCLLEFEGRLVNAPLMYEEVLSHQYGDWRTPVIETGKSRFRQHGKVIFDPHRSYVDFFRQSDEAMARENPSQSESL